MVNLIRLFPDMTFEELSKRTAENKVLMDKDYQPDFKIGASVFRERPQNVLKRYVFFWKKARNLMILIDGNPSAIDFINPALNGPPEAGKQKPWLGLNFGSEKDTKRFIAKLMAKAKVDQKPMSNFQFLGIAGLLIAVLMFQFLLMKGITF